MVGMDFIVGVSLAVALTLMGLAAYRYVMEQSPCFGDHDLTNYATTGDYRVVAEPALQVLPEYQCDVEVIREYAANCQRLGCDHSDTKWKTERETTVTVQSLEDIPAVLIEDED